MKDSGRSLAVRIDGRVAQRPVDGEAEVAPHFLVGLCPLRSLFHAEFAELLTRNIGLVDVISLLDEAFRRQPVVVETHRIEDVESAHPLVSDDEFGLCVGHGMADMQMRR